jgi:hypothetical protein
VTRSQARSRAGDGPTRVVPDELQRGLPARPQPLATPRQAWMVSATGRPSRSARHLGATGQVWPVGARAVGSDIAAAAPARPGRAAPRLGPGMAGGRRSGAPGLVAQPSAQSGRRLGEADQGVAPLFACGRMGRIRAGRSRAWPAATCRPAAPAWPAPSRGHRAGGSARGGGDLGRRGKVHRRVACDVAWAAVEQRAQPRGTAARGGGWVLGAGRRGQRPPRPGADFGRAGVARPPLAAPHPAGDRAGCGAPPTREVDLPRAARRRRASARPGQRVAFGVRERAHTPWCFPATKRSTPARSLRTH